MDPDKVFMVQKNVRDNVNTLQSYLTDLQCWESEMKRKEAALKGELEQDLPPVRSKVKKEKPVVPAKKKPTPRIRSSDYSSWEKFDVDKACEEVDMEDVGPTSLDSKKSQQDKKGKLREEAQYEKERGNNFVKQEKWDEAISCYNRAIELVSNDAIYYANRGLCHLMKDSLHLAEADCTEALKLDPTYVKAFQRRATAREKLGSLKAASNDLNEVLKLEPHNVAAKKQLLAIKARMGTKGNKSKSSPSSTPTMESKPFVPTSPPKIVELKDEPTPMGDARNESKTEKPKEPSAIEKWMAGVDEPITVIKPTKKPPHLRSKRPLISVPIYEVKLGESLPEKTRMRIVEVDNLAQGDTNNNKSETTVTSNKNTKVGDGDIKTSQTNGLSPEKEKFHDDTLETERIKLKEDLVPPNNSVQFMSQWKSLKGSGSARADYLCIIDPTKLPSIFDNALESDVLSELLNVIKDNKEKFKEKTVTAYLKGIIGVKRFTALAMFLSSPDKELVHKLLVHCRTVEGCKEEEIADLKNKFEL